MLNIYIVQSFDLEFLHCTMYVHYTIIAYGYVYFKLSDIRELNVYTSRAPPVTVTTTKTWQFNWNWTMSSNSSSLSVSRKCFNCLILVNIIKWINEWCYYGSYFSPLHTWYLALFQISWLTRFILSSATDTRTNWEKEHSGSMAVILTQVWYYKLCKLLIFNVCR